MPVFDSVFYEIAALLAVAAVCGGMAVWLRQPLIVAFIGVGILVGPSGLDWVRSSDQVDLLAKMGITLLLFVVGLKLDLHLIRDTGPVALATGIGQVLFTSIIGYGLGRLLGMPPVTALYVAAALTFSSTIIIVKLLSDKREIDSLHGRIAVGFLIVQDIIVVLLMIGLSAFESSGATGGLGVALLVVLAKGTAFLASILLLMRFLLPRLLHRLAHSQELLILFAVTWGIVLASVGDALGFSHEVGAFTAGVSLASTSYRELIGARLVGLRDFLLLFFFVGLGAEQDISLMGTQLISAAVLSVFVLVGNPLIVMLIMGAMGYRKRTGFLAGLTVAQISEFSFILGSLGVSLGHIDQQALGLITLVGFVTIGLSTYMILYSHVVYDRFAPWLGIFERRVAHREAADADAPPNVRHADLIIFGLGRYGGRIAAALHARGRAVLGIDFDPQAVAAAERNGLQACYGDAEDPELVPLLPLASCRWVICTTAVPDVNLALLQALRHAGYAGRVALTAHTVHDAERFTRAGADLVLRPHADAAERAVEKFLTALSADRPSGARSPRAVGDRPLRPSPGHKT